MVVTYHSFDRVVEAEHESADGGLPCTRLPDDGRGRPRLNKERYPSKTAVTVDDKAEEIGQSNSEGIN